MNNEKNLYIIVGVVSVLACGFLFFKSQPGESQKSGVTFKQLDNMKRDMKFKKELESKKVSVENFSTAPTLSNTYRPVSDDSNNGRSSVVLESEKLHAAQENLDDRRAHQPVNMLEAQINKKLVNDQRAQQMSVAQKQAFIESYKKQALASGYLVELNDDLVVVKVQKVAKAKDKGPASIPQEDISIQEEEYEEEE